MTGKSKPKPKMLAGVMYTERHWTVLGKVTGPQTLKMAGVSHHKRYTVRVSG